MDERRVEVDRILTRTGGYLSGIASHSLQPYRGCSFGSALCGSYCYVQHNAWVTRGRPWGGFLEVRTNAGERYDQTAEAERRWCASRGGRFSIFFSSATDPFLPQEDRHRVSERLMEAMLRRPPDDLILQTHTHRVAARLPLLRSLAGRTNLRVHLTIETDRDRIPGLPLHASPIEARFEAARTLKEAGLQVTITVSPILPIADPSAFFRRIAACADGVVLDHFVGGDGTPDGRRTRKTPLPVAMEGLESGSSGLGYRDRMAAVAQDVMPGRVGIGAAGFAGRRADFVGGAC